MSDPVSHILSLGRALPPEDRERLVEQLMESLNEPAAAELDTAWENEIQRRLAEFERGEVLPIDAEDVFAKAHRIAR
jgi:putative addiction module component (TIGR02574 family)